jgi:hypothetical protein
LPLPHATFQKTNNTRYKKDNSKKLSHETPLINTPETKIHVISEPPKHVTNVPKPRSGDYFGPVRISRSIKLATPAPPQVPVRKGHKKTVFDRKFATLSGEPKGLSPLPRPYGEPKGEG